MAFIPRKTNNDEKVVRDLLMNGFMIRWDGSGCHDVLQRISHIHLTGNVGFETTYEVKADPFTRDAFKNVCNALKQEGYEICKVRCSGSGCCQYATYAYYLAGDIE